MSSRWHLEFVECTFLHVLLSGFLSYEGASGIVNRGCHNPPNCNTGELHAGSESGLEL